MSKAVKHVTVRSVRFSPDDDFAIKNAADEEGVCFSEFVRRAALSRCEARLGFSKSSAIPFELARHICTAVSMQILTGTPLIEGASFPQGKGCSTNR